MRDTIHPNVLVQELPVEVAAHSIIDEALLLLWRQSRLVFEHSVIVPLPLQREVTCMQQWVAFHDLVPAQPLVLLLLQLLLRLLLCLALLLDLSELPHELLSVLIIIVVLLLGLLRVAGRGCIVGILWEWVVLNRCRPPAQVICLIPHFLAIPLVTRLLLTALELLADLFPRAALLRHALACLTRLEGEHACSIAVCDLCGLRHKEAAAWVGPAA
mmetsp:Transcript_101639/g.282884  ORF Transcript_101639/g.282884 Transcript_101639/m.282884 type:complete len:215 (+) Transcript_101639:79-723(+)